MSKSTIGIMFEIFPEKEKRGGGLNLVDAQGCVVGSAKIG